MHRDAYNKTPPKDEYSYNGRKSTVSTNLKPKRRNRGSIRYVAQASKQESVETNWEEV